MDSTFAIRTEEELASLGVTAKLLTTAQRGDLDKQGYLVLPGVVGARELDRLQSAFDRACDLENLPPGGTRHPSNLIAMRLSGASSRTPSCQPPFCIFWRARFEVVAAAGRDPQQGHGQQGLHINCVDSGPGTPLQAVTAIGLLDDFTPANGATRLVPGSHRFRRAPFKSLSPTRRAYTPIKSW
jgi:Phytanoyl-CoA dioxygenase (PhyH)